MRERFTEKENIVSTTKNIEIMTKFNEKSLHSFALAFFYAAMQAFDSRMTDVESTLQRLVAMRQELHHLFAVFDEALDAHYR